MAAPENLDVFPGPLRVIGWKMSNLNCHKPLTHMSGFDQFEKHAERMQRSITRIFFNEETHVHLEKTVYMRQRRVPTTLTNKIKHKDWTDTSLYPKSDLSSGRDIAEHSG